MDPVQATYLAWIDTRALNLPDPTRFFADAGVGLSDGRDFAAEGFVRLNFACPRPTLTNALHRLQSALAQPPRS
jgi:cystathionine beta-lyase